MKIKGVDPFNNNGLEDFKIPILKAFKSEIVLLATTNLVGKEKIESEKKDEEKDRNENEGDSESDNSEDNKDVNNNVYLQAHLEKIGNNSDEE